MLKLAEAIRVRLIALPRLYKRLLEVVADVLLVWVALWLAFAVRYGDAQQVEPLAGHAWVFVMAPLIAIPLFSMFGMYRSVMRYLGSDALLAMGKAVSFSALLLALSVYWYQDAPKVVPRSMVFNYWLLSLLLIGGLRMLMRQFFVGDWYTFKPQFSLNLKVPALPRVAIYGAGAAGNQLVAALRLGRAMRPVAFIDDDPGITDRVIAGLRVYSSKQIRQLISDTAADQILLAIPSATRARRREVLEALEHYPLRVLSIPGFMDLASGRVKVDDVQEVDIADLLGRDPVPPQMTLFNRCVRGQVVMVTGAGGSIGSELCRQLITAEPTTLLLFEHSEFNLYSIHAELELRVNRESLPLRLIPILGSIRDPDLLLDVMQTWAVNTVYHAAAYKHVPMVEHNMAEGVLNNVLGSTYAAQAAIKAGVDSFVLISTDKAVRPTNVMGCSKRLAEMVMQALSAESAPVLLGDKETLHQFNKTRFTMVRFGNVLGSSGSVIPLFREQIRRGGPVTVTHPNITRYFMTIPEAAQLVIQAGAMGQGGDVFLLDMGQPVKIAELAEKMIKLSGLKVRSGSEPGGDIVLEFTGLRPGEKLYEEWLIGDDALLTEHPMILRANEECLCWKDLKRALIDLLAALEQKDYARVREQLRAVVAGYTPETEIVDWFYQQRHLPAEEGAEGPGA